MHLHFERNSNAKCDCTILSLTWMGKVPDELPEEEGWKLNRTNYYQEGWLATGNVRGIVGVTFTTSHCSKPLDSPPPRTNYNLRGHRSEVMLVKWNEPYQKLASCDASGIIFVWIKYEGRWSIELINDRNTPVTHFSWSHDGRMALICYQDGFVLVGSVAGQRYWSSMLTLPATITCGIWTPDDQQVYFGTTAGQLIVMDVHGAMVSQVQLAGDVGVTAMAWSCEKFKMEEGDDLDGGGGGSERTFVLAVSLQNGYVFLMKSYDDVAPTQVCTGLQGPLCLEWSNSRELLAVAGTTGQTIGEFRTNVIKFYSETGVLIYSTLVPQAQSCVTALTWGHNDRRLFVATGALIHAAWVSKRVASLQLLCRLGVQAALPAEDAVCRLPLPSRLKASIASLFAQTIRCCVPSRSALREFVWRPPDGATRLHCTMIRHDDQPDTCYTLYLEYLGGLVPLLKGRRTSRIRPEFVVYDPQADDSMSGGAVCVSDSPETSGGEETTCGSPRIRRRRPAPQSAPPPPPAGAARDEDLAYLDTLPETGRLAQVTSNIWGTKFKLHGLNGRQCPPLLLGTVTYKTSLLHLQPRQMSLLMTQLAPLNDFDGGSPESAFPPATGQDVPFSEDEDEDIARMAAGPSRMAPVAPMTPQLAHLARRSGNFVAINRGAANASLTARAGAGLLPRASAAAAAAADRTESPLASRRNDTRPVEATAAGRSADVRGVDARSNDAERPGESRGAELARKNSARAGEILRSNAALLARGNDIVRNNTTLAPRANEVVRNGETLRSGPLASKSAEPLKAAGADGSNVGGGGGGAEVAAAGAGAQRDEADKGGRGHLALDLRSVVMKRIDILENNRLQEAAILRSDGAGDVTVLNSRRRERGRASPSGNQVGVAATKWCVARGDEPSPLEPLARSCSLGYLDLLDAQLLPASMLLLKDSPKRLVLVNRKRQRRAKPVERRGPRLRHCRKSRSLDSAEMLATNDRHQPLPVATTVAAAAVEAEPSVSPPAKEPPPKTSFFRMRRKNTPTAAAAAAAAAEGTPRTKRRTLVESLSLLSGRGRNGYDTRSLPPGSPMPAPRLPHSSPNTPLPSKKERRNQSTSPIRKHLLNSPLLRRKRNSGRLAESSDEEASAASGDEVFDGKNYRDLESFQKSQLRQKLLRGKKCEEACAGNGVNGNVNGGGGGYVAPRRNELRMRNKAPMWNENSQVYQLDFGGRVTQESAKNFQIEFRGKQVMQFGRIDGNAYTLDFQQPFSALQAFAVALANVTQRLK